MREIVELKTEVGPTSPWSREAKILGAIQDGIAEVGYRRPAVRAALGLAVTMLRGNYKHDAGAAVNACLQASVAVGELENWLMRDERTAAFMRSFRSSQSRVEWGMS